MSIHVECAELLGGEGELHRLRLRFKMLGARPAPVPTTFIVAADCSGSMSGRPMEQVKGALQYMARTAFENALVKLECVVYNSFARNLVLTPTTYESIINGVRADGQTCFAAAFREVLEIAKQRHTPSGNIVGIFMTDGADTSKENPTQACETFSKGLRSLRGTGAVVMHAIGFTSEHQFALLDKIRSAGKRPGVFRYAEPSDGIDALKNKFQEVFDGVCWGAADVALELKSASIAPASGAFPTQAIVDQDGVAEISMWVRIVGDEEPKAGATTPRARTLTVTLVVQGTAHTIALEQRAHEMPAGIWKALQLELEADALSAAMAAAATHGALRVAEWGPQLAALQERVRAVAIFGERGLTKERRHELLGIRGEVQERLDGLHRLLAASAQSAVASGATSLMARAADISFAAHFSKARRQRMLDRRVVSNAGGAAALEARLRELHAGRAAEALALSKEALEFYFCTLSQCSVEDLMRDDFSEVLGFGLAVQRSEAVVDCPTLMRLCNISSTLCARSALEDAVRYSISIEGHIRTHGGFEQQSELGVAVRGRSRDPINAWLPLYITKEHWQRVALLMSPTLGYFCCLNPLAFDPEQYNVLFTVLGTMIGRISATTSERDLCLLFAFQRTCRQAAVDFGLLSTLTAKVKAFTESIAGRTKDVVGNLLTMMGYATVLDVDQIDRKAFFAAMLCETVRRAADVLLRNRTEATVNEIAFRLAHGSAAEQASDALRATVLAGAREELDEDGVHTADPGAEAFTGWSFAPAPDGATATAAAPVRVEAKMMAALQAHGMAICEALPGPHIEERAHKARTACERWWASLREAAATVTLCDDYDPERVTHSMLATMAELDRQLTRVAWPSWTALRAMHDFLALWATLAAECGGGSAWEHLDEHSGIAPQSWVDKALAIRPTAACSLPALVALASPDDALQCERVLMLQAVRYHSNKDARAAGGDNSALLDLALSTDACACVLRDFNTWLRPVMAAAMESIQENLRWQRANRVMCECKELYAFIGVLNLAYNDRGQGFSELVEMMKDRALDIPLRVEKLEILFGGRYRDAVAFCRGNRWLPQTMEARNALMAAVGHEAYMDMEVRLRGRVQLHVYRPSDIPNRHGYCNSNPHDPGCCPKCHARKC